MTEMLNNATAPAAPFPHPQTLNWTGGRWNTAAPWDELQVRMNESLPTSAYTITVTAEGATLEAGSEAAIADGRNTFAQLVLDSPDGSIPCVTIRDQPRFAWRGLTLDVARHMFSVEDILSLLDAMALHRLNVLHLHLADDQGWRFEVPGYPRLLEISTQRQRTLDGPQTDDPGQWSFDDTPYGGYYTSEDFERLIEHAAHRGITLIPGIELPGHMQAALAAYPTLGINPDQLVEVREVWSTSDAVLGVSDEAFQFVEDAVSELARIFPGAFVHIGGADVPLHAWDGVPAVNAFLRDHKLSRVHEVHAAFIRRAAETLSETGKRAIVWSDALHTHIPDDVVVMDRTTHGESRMVARQGFQVVSAPSDVVSLDVYQGQALSEPVASAGLISLRELHDAEIVPSSLAKLGPQGLLGVHAMLWTPYVSTRGQMHRMLFPRLAAIAEHAWGSPMESSYRDWEDRLRTHLPRLDAMNISHHPLD